MTDGIVITVIVQGAGDLMRPAVDAGRDQRQNEKTISGQTGDAHSRVDCLVIVNV